MTQAHRDEHTGNASLDRIQGNVRSLIAYVRAVVERIAAAEAHHGLAKLATIELTGKTATTMSAADFASGHWMFTGALAADCEVRVPRATDLSVWSRYAFNVTSGGCNVTVANDDGSVTIGPATQIHIIASGTNGPADWT